MINRIFFLLVISYVLSITVSGDFLILNTLPFGIIITYVKESLSVIPHIQQSHAIRDKTVFNIYYPLADQKYHN